MDMSLAFLLQLFQEKFLKTKKKEIQYQERSNKIIIIFLNKVKKYTKTLVVTDIFKTYFAIITDNIKLNILYYLYFKLLKMQKQRSI